MKKKYTEREELYFSYLDDLRESGVTNMYGAAPYLEAEFGLEAKEAKDALIKWMKSFKDRAEPEEEAVEEPEEEVKAVGKENHVEKMVGETRYDVCPVHIDPSEHETFAYHKADEEYYRVDKYTDKRVYFSEEPKKFAPKHMIEVYVVSSDKG